MKALIHLILFVTLCIYINEYNVLLVCCELSKRESGQTRQAEYNKGDTIEINNNTTNNSNLKIKQIYLFQRVTNVLHFHIICKS